MTATCKAGAVTTKFSKFKAEDSMFEMRPRSLGDRILSPSSSGTYAVGSKR
jgi:hypothetical protein